MHLKAISFLGLAVALAASAAQAGDVSYSDGRGNLVVESDAGYKRIIVGEGARAGELSGFVSQSRGYADGLGATRILPDSHGNLTIRAAAGYKRILVGRADEVDAAVRDVRTGRATRRDADADFYSDAAAHEVAVVCAGSDGIIRGRSYMYGLDRNETPVILTCE